MKASRLSGKKTQYERTNAPSADQVLDQLLRGGSNVVRIRTQDGTKKTVSPSVYTPWLVLITMLHIVIQGMRTLGAVSEPKNAG